MTADDLTVEDATQVLSRLTPGAEIELGAAAMGVLGRLERAGYVARASDPERDRRALADRKAELAALGPRGDAARIAVLRREILAISEALATSDGAARVRTGEGAGPYRGAITFEGAYVLTQSGRALLSNLGPRAARAPRLTLSDFDAQLAALDEILGARARRATDLVTRIAPKTAPALPLHALRSAMLGLASLPHPNGPLGDAFVVLYTAIRQTHASVPCTPAQDASIAEALLLHYVDLRPAYDPTLASALVAMRDDIARRYCAGRTEDALDATLLLAAVPASDRQPRIDRAAAFASAMARVSVPTPLSLALLATAGGPALESVELVTRADRHVLSRSADPLEALTTAVLATMQITHPLEAQLARIDALHAYLMRTGPGMMVAAALLALLDGDPAGLLDDLRLAARQVTEQRLAPGGVEATALGVKLLLHSALLARGAEGDPEEKLALALRALPALAAFELGAQGLGTMSATLPLLATTVTAFHRPMLEAAVLYEQHSRPMHSDYVFGGGWSGSTAHRGSYGHRSFGWG